MKPIVYFYKNITSKNLINIYEKLGVELKGNLAVKIHSGEDGNQNYMKPEFLEPLISYVKGTIVECNTAYEGSRNTTKKHEKTMLSHGWKAIAPVDIMDSEGEVSLPITWGKHLKCDYVGSHLLNYDSMLVLSHFKGHPMGGYGGALKQLSIGCASSAGKANIHSAGRTLNQKELWNTLPTQDKFLESMADAASSVVKYFNGNIAFINIMCNMSVDCDCCSVAEDPCMKDIGILSSTDPVALDQACIDLIYASKDRGRDHLIERIESRHGIHTIEAASTLGFGTRDYELINIDN